MHVGIDLGTTNSALASYDGTVVRVVPNALGELLTPSVVRIDARGTVTVGRRAFRYLETDPLNTRAEFKRLMGSEERLSFEASGRAQLPEELSAAVLSSLLADARDALGFLPRAAVISTPALFEVPQNHATTRAAQGAGLEEVALIQEPVASAIAAGWDADAAGFWLVYDLGGGTLDVTLMETREGWLRVVDHGGDNYLGGKDFDTALADWALARLRAQHPLPQLARDNPNARRALGRLKAACEQAKIDLTRGEQASIAVPELCVDADGQGVDVDLLVTRPELEGLVGGLVRRSIGICEGLLQAHGLTPAAVERVVFVGGPTLMPLVRRQVGEALGGRVAEGVDPMTIVARGAALYAATAGLEARPVSTAAVPAGLPLRLTHPTVTADLEPYVVGRFMPGEGEALPARVRVVREGAGAPGPPTDVTAEGTFVLQVTLERHQQNRFRVTAFDARDVQVALRGDTFAIVHGLSVADPPLSRAVGVALSDNTVHVYFNKGTPLPARRTYPHLTVEAVSPGGGQDLLKIPIVQGEFHRAHRNRLIGTLHIRGQGLRKAIASGTRLEVTLELDRSGQLRARADVAGLGQTFEDVAHVLVPAASPEVLARETEAGTRRCEDVRRRAFSGNQPEVVVGVERATALLGEATRGLPAAEGGDADAAQQVHRLLLELNGLLDAAEERLEWPELEGEAFDTIHSSLSWVAAWGTPSERDLFDQALAAARAAQQQRRAGELDRQLRVMRSLGHAAFLRDPEMVVYELDWYAAHLSEATDLQKAQALVDKGRALLARDDRAGVRALLPALRDLFPGTVHERQRSFGSGVR
jgi:molecular chaperone DnaK